MPIGAYKLNAIGRLGAAATAFDNTFKTFRSTRNPNTNTTDNLDDFGINFGPVDMNNQYYIVGAPNEDPSNVVNAGIAYVFSTTTGNLVTTLNNPYPSGNISQSDSFGITVGINSTQAWVGEYGTPLASGGNVYVFSLPSGTLQYTISSPVPGGQVGFGDSLKVSDDYAIVDSGLNDRVYVYNTSNATVKYTLNRPSGVSSINPAGITDQYAAVSSNTGNLYVYSTATGNLVYNFQSGFTGVRSYDISDSYAAIGGNNQVKVYNLSNGSLRYTLTNPNYDPTSSDDQFGSTVEVNDSFLMVHATDEDPGGPSVAQNLGVNYIFNTATGILVQTLINPYSISNFGTSAGTVTDRYAIMGVLGYTYSGPTIQPSDQFESVVVYSRLTSDPAAGYSQPGYAPDGYVSPVF